MAILAVRPPMIHAGPVDPIFRRLPSHDGTPRYIPLEVATVTAGRLTLGYLRSRRAWCVHRVGRAAYAHGAQGAHRARWIIGITTGDDLPAWWPRLLERAKMSAPGGFTQGRSQS